jgi:predicted SnoaL-like aldol condensation-catalyzing enzyme
MGMPKGPYDMTAIEVSKFKDGKAVEHWSFMNMQEMMKMMPQQPNMNMNNKDTAKMRK